MTSSRHQHGYCVYTDIIGRGVPGGPLFQLHAGLFTAGSHCHPVHPFDPVLHIPQNFPPLRKVAQSFEERTTTTTLFGNRFTYVDCQGARCRDLASRVPLSVSPPSCWKTLGEYPPVSSTFVPIGVAPLRHDLSPVRHPRRCHHHHQPRRASCGPRLLSLCQTTLSFL